MQINQLLSAPLIDIIFDGRNKSYGAYELRKTYESRILTSLIITLLVTAVGFGSYLLSKSFKKPSPNYRISEGHWFMNITEGKKPENLPEPERKKPQQNNTQTKAFVNNFHVRDNPPSPPPSQHDLGHANIDTDTKEGKPYEGEVNPGPVDISGRPGNDEDKPVIDKGPAETVDIDAKFDGDWKRFLEKNLDANIPVSNNAPPGRYSVIIRFVVDTDGNISEIIPLTQHGYGLEEEAIRVIRKAKKWQPAFLNGNPVKAYKKQVIVFIVEEGQP